MYSNLQAYPLNTFIFTMGFNLNKIAVKHQCLHKKNVEEKSVWGLIFSLYFTT